MTVTTHRLLREDSFFFLLEDESGILLLEVGTLIYEDSSGTNPDEIYSSGSGSGPFLYEETSGTNPDEIYEV